MSKKRASSPSLPACYALSIPGLEVIAAEEITDTLGAEIRKKFNGAVVFRTDDISDRLLDLRTSEDVFLLAWGTDELTYRALDLENIRRWTAHGNWDHLLRIHHGIRPKPKGKPTFRLVTQMHGQHGYRRIDAGKALGKGLAGKLPASWRHVEENASVEIWLTIQGRRALCGLRLSDKSMRHRQYKREHIPASLRPTVAAAMVRLAKPHWGEFILDPMCGAGTILAELGDFWKRTSLGREPEKLQVWAGDVDSRALRSARSNLIRFEAMRLARWDARHLPFSDHTVNCIISNPPFGVQLKPSEGLPSFYRRLMKELDRVLRPGGRTVLLVSDFDALKEAAAGVNWKLMKEFEVRILGQLSTLALWQKGIARHE